LIGFVEQAPDVCQPLFRICRQLELESRHAYAPL
jgi:hypothetical protein